MSSSVTHDLIQAFEQTLHECKHLYLSSARLCIEEYPALIPDAPREFYQLMGDLHRGLLIKVYTSMVDADMGWSPAERHLAKILFYHIWKQQLSDADLRDAIQHVAREGRTLKWYSLVRPFDQIAPLRDRVAELDTVVMRAANLIAKVNGNVSPGEEHALRTMQRELDECLRKVPIDEPSQHKYADQLGAQAIQQLQEESSNLHDSRAPAEGVEIVAEETSPAARLADALAELEGLIGLAGVKQEVQTLTNLIQLQQQRAEHGLPIAPLSLHMVFNGNPGTGKTSVARIVGHIYGGMKILEKGHLVETDRSGLVAEYAGQTAVKANKKIDEALGGVLFIDEAYSLVASDSEDPYGREAIQTLLKRMEDDRDRLVVILAGYPEPMKQLISSNPGLQSRFNTQLTFDDYTPREMGKIFEVFCKKNHFDIGADSRVKLLVALAHHYGHRDEHFGNGRVVRNIFENSIRRLANRIAGIAPLTKQVLTTFEFDDIDVESVPPKIWADVDLESLRITVECIGCGTPSIVPAKYLGRRVRCKKCEQRFVADWGELDVG